MSFLNSFQKTHVFISYRRRSESDEAGKSGLGERVSKHLYAWLIDTRPNMSVFYDRPPSSKNRLRGEYWKQIQQELKKTTHLILILPPDALARCYEPDDEVEPEDVFGYEIRNALRQGCKIIPVFIGSSKDREFRDKTGNVIPRRGYDLLPEKFREEAKAHNLLGLERYNIDVRDDFLSEDDSDERANERWNYIFTEEVLPSAPRKSSLPLLALATAVAAGGVFFLKYRHADAPAEPKAPVTVALGAPVEPNTDARKKADEEKAAREREEAEKAKKEEARRKAEEERLRREAEEKLAAANAAMRTALAEAVAEYSKDEVNPAAIMNSLSRCAAAVSEGADPNIVFGDEKQTALHLATTIKAHGLAGKFLASGANPNARDAWGCTPLHNAVLRGDSEMIRLLLECGANKSVGDNNGKTPADFASGTPEILKLLQ